MNQTDREHLLPGISVAVPVYNSEKILPLLIERLLPVLQAISGAYELILVNDGSWDNSWVVIKKLCRDHRWIVGVDLMKNYGQHNALLCGIRKARFDTVVTMDDDLQNPPEEIPLLLSRLAEGYDVVYGTPQREQNGMLRNLASRVTKLLLQGSMGIRNARMVSTYRAFRTDIRRAFTSYHGKYVFIDSLLSWGARSFAAVTVRHEPRPSGSSNYNFFKLVAHALNMLTGFSIIPLRLSSITGFAFTLFGFATLCYVLGRYLLWGCPVAGFSFLASLITIFSGVQLFSLGIIGEYLARIHSRSMDISPYVIRSLTEGNMAE